MILSRESKCFQKPGVDAIVIDTAHGHSAGVLNTIREARKSSNMSR